MTKCYVESLPFVVKDKKSCFSQGERFTVQLPLDHALALRKQNAYLTFGNDHKRINHLTDIFSAVENYLEFHCVFIVIFLDSGVSVWAAT